jgi:hypothetical protein
LILRTDWRQAIAMIGIVLYNWAAAEGIEDPESVSALRICA